MQMDPNEIYQNHWMQKLSEWNHKDSESKEKWRRTTRDVPVRVKLQSETNDTQNANRKCQVKECSKPNLKSERNWGVIEVMTQWHVQQWRKRQSAKTKWKRMKRKNEAQGYYKSLILTR